MGWSGGVAGEVIDRAAGGGGGDADSGPEPPLLIEVALRRVGLAGGFD